MKRALLAAAIALLMGVPAACSTADSPSGSASTVPGATAPTVPDGWLDLTGWKVDEIDGEFVVPRELVRVDDTRTLLVDQVGRVHVLESGSVRSEPLLDVTARVLSPSSNALELGLAGFTLAPDFATSGHIYTFTTEPPRKGDPKSTVRADTITRWTVDRAALVADPASARFIFRLPRNVDDHVGGDLVFDDAGLLYAGLGTPGDAKDLAQNPKTFDGTVIRIKPTKDGYVPPRGNAKGARPEVWTYGYRNPWRLAYDPTLGVLVGSAMFGDKPQQGNQPKTGDQRRLPRRHHRLLAGQHPARLLQADRRWKADRSPGDRVPTRDRHDPQRRDAAVCRRVGRSRPRLGLEWRRPRRNPR